MRTKPLMHFDAASFTPEFGVRGAVGQLTHQALLYGSDEEFLAGALPGLHCGIQRSERTLAITTPANADLLRAALGADAAAVEFADSAEWFREPGWVFGEYHRYVRRHTDEDSRLWLLVQPDWAGWNEWQCVEWQRCESILNTAFSWAPLSLVCAYDSRTLRAQIVEHALLNHPALVRGEWAVGSDRYVQPAEYVAEYHVLVGPAPEDAHVLRFDVGDLSTVRAVATAWARREVLTDDQVRDLLIAVHEIASNAVEHGGGSGVIRFWGSEDALTCEVSSSRPLSQPYPGYLPPDTGQERGRGLWMARQICTRVDVIARAEGGVDVRITMPRAERSSPA